MAQVCMVTGTRPLTGMNVSHSHIRTKRRLMPNLHSKRYWVPSENRWVKLRLSAKGMRIIDKRGIEAVLVDLRKRGLKV
ncbi:MAG: 50S ribosomal protein L28 [Myxococcales bacterium]|nr:50S ribosomal protein L28 [Myxococcales bacterium]MCB9715587.1 50S ribosomal protein L28 [Myxococcales bacterium]